MASQTLLVQRRAQALSNMTDGIQEIAGMLGFRQPPPPQGRFPDEQHRQVAYGEWMAETVNEILRKLREDPRYDKPKNIPQSARLPLQPENATQFPKRGASLNTLINTGETQPNEMANDEDQLGMKEAEKGDPTQLDPEIMGMPLKTYMGKSDEEILAVKGVGRTTLKQIRELLKERYGEQPPPRGRQNAS